MTDVVLEQKQEVKVYSPFGKRNANNEKIEQEEAELKELQEANKGEKKQEEDDSNLSSEEKTFKKRYGDLRRHSQQQQTQLQTQIDELKSQLQKSTTNQIKLPKTEEELAAWSEQYPDVAKIVESIAMKKAKEQSESIELRLRSLDERELETARDKAEGELLRLHPDFDKIRDTDDFHDWVEEQPKWVQQALYENDTDAKAAARAIDLYKVDKGITKSKTKESNKGAELSVGARGSRSSPADVNTDGVVYESVVNQMNSHQYEENQEAIAKAIKSGKFVYDISGNAR